MLEMEIVVTDANIFLDLWNTGLMDGFCPMGWRIHTTDFVLAELYAPDEMREKMAGLIAGKKIIVAPFSPTKYAGMLRLMRKGLSEADCSVLYYAKSGGYAVLTGDKALRKAAESMGIDVRGIFHVFDAMKDNDLLTEEEYRAGLIKLMSTNKRLPLQEFVKRLDSSK